MVACKNGGPWKMYLRLQKWRHFGYSISEGRVYVARNIPRMKGANTRTEWNLFHEFVHLWINLFHACPQSGLDHESPQGDFKLLHDPYQGLSSSIQKKQLVLECF